jgi:hypothetical protein
MESISITSFSREEAALIGAFAKAAEKVAKTSGVRSSEWDFYSITSSVDIDLSVLPKEGVVMVGLWVCFLSIMRKQLPSSCLKYNNVNSFLAEYPGKFDKCDMEEKRCLFDTANWMCVMLKMVSARKNKGLAIQVVPKLVEGWHVKYVTGSGQKKTTADRVHIFETEGCVQAHHRGRLRIKSLKSLVAKRSMKKSISKVAKPTSATYRTLHTCAPKSYSLRVPRVHVDFRDSDQLDVRSPTNSALDCAETDGEVDDDFTDDDDCSVHAAEQEHESEAEAEEAEDKEDFAECLSLLRSYTGCQQSSSHYASNFDSLDPVGPEMSIGACFDFNFTPIEITVEEGNGLSKPKLTRIYSWGQSTAQDEDPSEIKSLLEGF